MKKYCLRHYRGSGIIIPDIVKDKYFDYPKHRGMRPYILSECIVKTITEDEYLDEIERKYGKEERVKKEKDIKK